MGDLGKLIVANGFKKLPNLVTLLETSCTVILPPPYGESSLVRRFDLLTRLR